MDTAIGHLQTMLHGDRSETVLTELDIYGASLGASEASGAAHGTRYDVYTLTLQEPIVARSGVFQLLGRILGSDAIGEPSNLSEGKDYIQLALIKEPTSRAEMDAHGNELTWFLRAIAAGARLRNRGMTHPEKNQTIKHWEALAGRGVDLLALIGENSGMADGSEKYLLDNGFDTITVRGTKGTKAAHEIDEHTALSSIGVPLNMTRGDYNLQAKPRSR
jgi:hypothetical protein